MQPLEMNQASFHVRRASLTVSGTLSLAIRAGTDTRAKPTRQQRRSNRRWTGSVSSSRRWRVEGEVSTWRPAMKTHRSASSNAAFTLKCVLLLLGHRVSCALLYLNLLRAFTSCVDLSVCVCLRVSETRNGIWLLTVNSLPPSSAAMAIRFHPLLSLMLALTIMDRLTGCWVVPLIAVVPSPYNAYCRCSLSLSLSLCLYRSSLALVLSLCCTHAFRCRQHSWG